MFFFKKEIRKGYKIKDWKFEIIIDNNRYDISKKIREKIQPNFILDINEKFDFKNFIYQKKLNYKNSYLRITNKKNKLWEPINIKEFTPFKLYLGEIISNKRLEIVYFINANLNESFLKLMRDQLKDLIKSKIYKHGLLKLNMIIICSSASKKIQIKNLIFSLKINQYFDYDIRFNNDDNKEYEGIKRVYELAKEDDDKLILYFHGKGLSYLSNKYFYIRQPLEKFIFNLIIGNWEKNLEKFYRIHSISKIGILSGGNGWLWFNFWIAKSSYLGKLEKPKKTKRAFYYEDWLGRYEIKNKIATSKIYTNESNQIFYDSANETLSILNSPKKNKYNLGSVCKVERGGFVGLGIIKYTYRIWYLFYVILNRLGLNKGEKDRFLFF